MNFFKKAIKKFFRSFGYEIHKISPQPSDTFLGLKNLPIRTIFDIGANEGEVARDLLKVFPKAQVFCFEPLPRPFKKLKKWAQNQPGKIKVFNLVLGDEIKENVKIYFTPNFTPSSSLLKTTPLCEKIFPFLKERKTLETKLTTLDQAVKDFSLPLLPKILIKIDVEGYEKRVLKGGKEVLKKTKACLIEISLASLHKGQGNFKSIFQFLSELGFEYKGNLEQAFHSNGHVIYGNSLFLRP